MLRTLFAVLLSITIGVPAYAEPLGPTNDLQKLTLSSNLQRREAARSRYTTGIVLMTVGASIAISLGVASYMAYYDREHDQKMWGEDGDIMGMGMAIFGGLASASAIIPGAVLLGDGKRELNALDRELQPMPTVAARF